MPRSRGTPLDRRGATRRDGRRSTWQVKRDKNRERFVHSKSLNRRVMSLLRSPSSSVSLPSYRRAHPPDKVFHFPHPRPAPQGQQPPRRIGPETLVFLDSAFELWLTDILGPGGYTKPTLRTCTYTCSYIRARAHGVS